MREGSNPADLSVHSKSMKTEYARVFAASAAQKVVNANALQMKTTWTQEDHHKAMAKVLAEVEITPGANPEQVFYDVVSECYNTSAFAQFLEKKFQGTGHFVRRDGKAKTVSGLEAELDAAMREASKPTTATGSA